MGRAVAEGLLAGGVAPVVKHMPGHGRARVDSHHELPVVDAARDDLKRDFAPFAALKDLPMAMSAHVLYTAIDPASSGDGVVDRGREDHARRNRVRRPHHERRRVDEGAARAHTKNAPPRSSRRDLISSCIATANSTRLAPWRPPTPALSGASLRRAKAALAAYRAPQPFDVEQGERELAAIKAELGVA